MALFDILKTINLFLKEAFEVSPVVLQPLKIDVHIFEFLPLDALQVVFAHLLVHLKDLVQLTTLAFSLFALGYTLVHEVAVHLGWVDIFLETATRHASILFTGISTLKRSLISSRGAAFELAALDFALHLGVDHTLATSHHHEALRVNVDLASHLGRDLEVAIFIKLTLDLVATLVHGE